jgi:uncharacterized delta-60 repeat protein
VAPGQPTTLTASVTPTLPTGIAPSGSVTFFDGSTTLGTGAVQANGIATFSTSSLPLGNQSITASFPGDASFLIGASTAITVAVAAPASIGGLDPNFGSMGVASHNVGIVSTAGLVVQGDGKSVIAGTGGASGAGLFVVTRYNADGSIDTTFGNNGVVNASFGGDDQAAAVAVLANGDILVAGTATTMVNGQAAGSQFALAEYTSAGVLDTTFGNGTGLAMASFAATGAPLSNDVAHALTVAPNGVIYVGGSSDAGGRGLDFAVAAFTPAGVPLAGFGTNGNALLDFTGGNDSIASLSMAPSGELIAGGSTGNPSTGITAVGLAEFNSSGAPDPNFGAGGKVTTSAGGIDDAAFSLATNSNGNIVAGGYTATGSASAGTLSANFLLLRYDSSGKLDNTFGTHGIVTTNFGQPAAVSTVLLQPDGTIVASGKTVASLVNLDPGSLDLAIARYTAKGQPDTTFNGNGRAIVSLSGGPVGASLNHNPGIVEQPFFRSASIVVFDATSDLMQAFMQLTQSDQGVIAVTPGGQLLEIGNNAGNTVEAAIVTTGLDLTASLSGSLPQSIIGGAKGSVSVTVSEAGSQLAAGTFTIELIATNSATLGTVQFPVQSFAEKMSLKEGKAKTYRLKFLYPSSLTDGNYYIAAVVETGAARDLNVANNTSVSTASTRIAAPFVQLTGGALTAPTFAGAKPASISFTISDSGNEPATTSFAVKFFASSTGTLTGAFALATESLRLALKPNASHPAKLKLALPATLPAGTYSLVALLDPANVFNDPNAATNFIVSGNSFVVG